MKSELPTPGARVVRACSWMAIGFLLALLVLPWFMAITFGVRL